MYRAPVKDACFILRELIGEDGLQACPAHAEYSLDLAEAVLEEAAKFEAMASSMLWSSDDLTNGFAAKARKEQAAFEGK